MSTKKYLQGLLTVLITLTLCFFISASVLVVAAVSTAEKIPTSDTPNNIFDKDLGRVSFEVENGFVEVIDPSTFKAYNIIWLDADGKKLEYDDPEQTILNKRDDGSLITNAFINFSKSATQTGDNEFEIGLKVETTDDIRNTFFSNPASVVLVLDVSTSMDSMMDLDATGREIKPGDPGWSINATRWNVTKEATKDFIEKLLRNPNNQISIVVYGGMASYGIPEIDDYTQVHWQICDWTSNAKEAIDSFYEYRFVSQSSVLFAGYDYNEIALRNRVFGDFGERFADTNCQAGFRGAIEQLADNSRKLTNNPFVIFMSDGIANRNYDDPISGSIPDSEIAAIIEVGKLKINYLKSILYTVGISEDAKDSRVLRKNANPALGNPYVEEYFSAEKAEDLSVIYEILLKEIYELSQAWTVTETMSDYVELDVGSVGAKEFYLNSFSVSGETIRWDLLNSDYVIRADDAGREMRTYALSYTITADPNLLDPGIIYPVNKQTSLEYVFFDSGLKPILPPQTAYFRVPGIVVPGSIDNCLTSLTISPGKLIPDFDPYEFEYEVSIGKSVSSMTIEAVAGDPNAFVVFGMGGVGIGEYSETIPLDLNQDRFEFDVSVVPDDGDSKVYSIVVIRQPDEDELKLTSLSITPGELTPDFEPNLTSYTVSVPNEVSRVTITAAAGDPDTFMLLNSGGIYIGKFSEELDLDEGENIFTISLLSASLEGDPEIYTIMIYRQEGEYKPIYIKEATGNIGTVGSVVFKMPDDPDFLDKYALVCDEDIEAEIYFSPQRTNYSLSVFNNIYIFAIRLPNGETREDLSFSFKPIGGEIEKNKDIIYGDVNEDGYVTTTDATLVTRWAGGNTATPLKNILAADVNGDAYITTTDATLITRRAGGNPSAVFSIETKVGLIVRPKGDINGDGIITVEDAMVLMQMLSGLIPMPDDPIFRAIADVNGDGIIDSADADLILRMVSGD